MTGYFDILVTLFMLTLLELVLCVDNLIFLAILVNKLPKSHQQRARFWGLSMAWITRLILLGLAVYLARIKTAIWTIEGIPISIRALFLALGGIFLIIKSAQEIHDDLEERALKRQHAVRTRFSFWSIVIQIALMDIVFSLDSVLTAVGLTPLFWVMALAITLSVIVIMSLSRVITEFIQLHPALKMLALCFLLAVGILLLADGFSFHIPRIYLYVAMAFALGVEVLNIAKRIR